MRFSGKIFAAVIGAIVSLALVGIPAYAQVQSVEEVTPPTPQFQDHGGVTPWFWIGVQTVFGAGYNFETTAGGFRNYGGDNHTYASFNLAFVDSHYQTPKFYEVPKELDPEAWTGHFIMMNFTSRANSWESGSTGWENNTQAWLAEITGKGTRIGFFTQAAELVGGIDGWDGSGSDQNNRKPITRIYGGNKVLDLGTGQLGKVYYEKNTDDKSITEYVATGSQSAIMYAGYEKKELWNVYLTMLSEGNVNTPITEVTVNGEKREAGKGFAGVIDFRVTPFGLFTDEESPLTFDVSGNFIAGFNFNSGANSNQNVGFGLKAESGIWLMDNLVLSPVLAFDGKLDTDQELSWKMGGGLVFRFSGMRWTNDEWGDLYNTGAPGGSTAIYPFADHRYENNKILKYAYAQIYGAYSEERDFNLLLRAEEPDGGIGFHDKLGAMFEMRLYNLAEENKVTAANGTVTGDMSWEAQARVSWDFNIGAYLVSPYIRAYTNKDEVFKLRIGAYANIIPFTGFELAYTSANLNSDVDLPKPSYLNSSYEKFFDAGRIELLIILKSDEIRPIVPKRMSDWNYPSVIQNF